MDHPLTFLIIPGVVLGIQIAYIHIAARSTRSALSLWDDWND